MLCAKFVKMGNMVLEEKILKFFIVFLLFCQYLPYIWKRCGPLFEQTWIVFTQGCFVPSLVELSRVVFCYFAIISTSKRAWPFIWTNMNCLWPRMLCAKFGWIGQWPVVSWEEIEKCKKKSLKIKGQTDGQTDDRRLEKLTCSFSSGELKMYPALKL